MPAASNGSSAWTNPKPYLYLLVVYRLHCKPIGSARCVSTYRISKLPNLFHSPHVQNQHPAVALRQGIGPAGALKKTGMAPGVSVKVFRDYKESRLDGSVLVEGAGF